MGGPGSGIKGHRTFYAVIGRSKVWPISRTFSKKKAARSYAKRIRAIGIVKARSIHAFKKWNMPG